MRAGLGEERAVAKLLHRQVQEREQQPDEHVGAQRAEHGLVRDAAVVQDAAERDRERRRHQQDDGQQVGQPDQPRPN